jgi:hypothetical protein
VDQLSCEARWADQGDRATAKKQKTRIKLAVGVPANKNTTAFQRPLLFAAETTGALVVPTPTRAFFFCGCLVFSEVVNENTLSLKTCQG